MSDEPLETGHRGPDDAREPRFSDPGAAMTTPPAPQPWERKVIEDLAFAALKEQRASRRWGIFFKSMTLLYASIVLIYLLAVAIKGSDADLGTRHTALVTLQGVIDAEGQASAEKINTAL